MSLIKFSGCVAGLTIVALIYVNLQMQIFDAAYGAKMKEKIILELAETNRRLAYRALELTSSQSLGDRLLTKETDLTFRRPDRVVRLVAQGSASPVTSTVSSEPPLARIWNLLLRKTETEARASELPQQRAVWHPLR